jgi:dipeptidyl aminopeptidase/acylaminoacyl peptidase
VALAASSITGGLFTPPCLVEQEVPGQLVIAGDLIVYTLRRVVCGTERTELWALPYDGGPARPLTSGAHHDHEPTVSPSGARLAFLRTDESGYAQAYVLDLPEPDGLPRRLTDFGRGAHGLAWSADESALIVLAEDTDSASVYRAPGISVEDRATALRLTTIDWRSDGDGHHGLRLHPRHLHRVPLDGGPTRRLTHGTWSAARPRVDDLDRVHFLADTHVDADLHPSPQVHRLDSDTDGGPATRQLTSLPSGVERYHVQGRRLRVLGHPSAHRPDDEPARWYEVADDGKLTPLGGEDQLPRWTGLLGDETDLHEWQLELDDAFDITTSSWRGSTMPSRTQTGTPLYPGQGVCGAVAQDGTRQVAILSLGTGAQAPDVYALEGDVRRITRHGAWLDEYHRPQWERREFAGPAGPITVHLLHPVDKVPMKGTVLALHGGPTGQWGVVPPVEALLLASAGYRVAMPNIRGSIDRGPAWVAPLRGAWGRVDATDALAVCDGLVAAGLAEAGRLGVIGLSYGGFLTQWLIGITDRFAAAVSENGVTNQVSAWAGCDTGPAFCRSSGLGDPLSAAGVERLWAASPLRNVAAIHTPLLMLQGADDRTCPASDNEQLFVALRTLRRPVEYVIYPEERHLMQATGRIDRRIDRHQRVLDWFDSHLGQGAQR